MWATQEACDLGRGGSVQLRWFLEGLPVGGCQPSWLQDNQRFIKERTGALKEALNSGEHL